MPGLSPECPSRRTAWKGPRCTPRIDDADVHRIGSDPARPQLLLVGGRRARDHRARARGSRDVVVDLDDHVPSTAGSTYTEAERLLLGLLAARRIEPNDLNCDTDLDRPFAAPSGASPSLS